MHEIVFWQAIVSPHMAGLVKALAAHGHRVVYIAIQLMTADRVQQGWLLPDMTGVQLQLPRSKSCAISLVDRFSNNAIHIMQGVRGNGILQAVIRKLRHRNARWGAIMETIDERYWMSIIKRIIYTNKLARSGIRPDFVLAIGDTMPDWVLARGFPYDRIFPFAYFLSPSSVETNQSKRLAKPFQIGFVGQLVPIKRLDLLIDALGDLQKQAFELVVVGDGPLKVDHQKRAIDKFGQKRLRMVGRLPMNEVYTYMKSFDCLVLPSDHDGWGAVVSEALMAGVQVICSDACGSKTVVHASGVGGVFPKGNVAALHALLKKILAHGPMSQSKREELSTWARCLGAAAGAVYIEAIIESVYQDRPKPTPPWYE